MPDDVASSDRQVRRLTDSISLGVLADLLPRDLIEDVLAQTGKREQRSRLLPAHVVVRFCMAMCLFWDDDYEEVIRKLVGSLEDMNSWSNDWHVPSVSAISQARSRLGSEPMRQLFEQVAVPIAGLGTRGAWLGPRRIMAVDGFVLDAPDTPKNVERFPLQTVGPGQSSYPQVRVLALGECGSHAIVDAAVSSTKTGEQALLPHLFRSLESDMLVLADRGFYSYDLWRKATETEAAQLWRVSSALTLPSLVELPDGSYLSVIYQTRLSAKNRAAIADMVRAGGTPHPIQAITVRVVEYRVTDRIGSGARETICLITSLLDAAEAPAAQLAAVYHERWEIESTFDELKTHQRGPGRVLRSKSPDLVEQEIWSLLLAHYAIRNLMCRAADEADLDPDRLSFSRSLRVVRRHITGQADFSP